MNLYRVPVTLTFYMPVVARDPDEARETASHYVDEEASGAIYSGTRFDMQEPEVLAKCPPGFYGCLPWGSNDNKECQDYFVRDGEEA